MKLNLFILGFSCFATFSLVGAKKITLHENYAYILNGNKTLTTCKINNDQISECFQTNDASLFGNNSNMKFYNEFVYITNPEQNKIFRCNADVNAQLKNCIDSDAKSLDRPTRIAPYKDHVYIINSGSKNISSCVIKSDGTLTNCKIASTDVSVDFVEDIAIFDDYLYMTNDDTDGSSSILTCRIENGEFEQCNSQTINNLFPSRPYKSLWTTDAFTIKNGRIYLPGYDFLNENSTVFSCKIDKGHFSECIQSSVLNADHAFGIDIAGNYLFLTNGQTSKLTSCRVGNGELLACRSTTLATQESDQTFNDVSTISIKL